MLRSDLVFLRAWIPVDLRRFCSVATTLLEVEKGARKESSTWRMRTTREIREQEGLSIPSKQDSQYKPITRAPRRFHPLQIPKKLAAELPYASQPKLMPKKKKKTIDKDRAVVMDPTQRREFTLMQMVSTVKNEREKKRKEANKERLEKKRKANSIDDEKHRLGEAQRRKRRYVTKGLQEKREKEKSEKKR